MNKGVEILLQRRKTNPEEFEADLNTYAYGRWLSILSSYGVCLDNPSTYPVGDKGVEFANKVMEELLVTDEPVNSLLTIEQITKHSMKLLHDALDKTHRINRETP